MFEASTYGLPCSSALRWPPTDAALGAAVITNPAVPAMVRIVLNVESGLNDGIVTPVVVVALAGAAAAKDRVRRAIMHSLNCCLVWASGILAGGVGGALLRKARSRGGRTTSSPDRPCSHSPCLLTPASLAYNGNGFVAAFTGGSPSPYRGRAGRRRSYYVEQTADCFAPGLDAVGLVAVPVVVDELDWRLLVYAVLQPDRGADGAGRPHAHGDQLAAARQMFIGWFGPRGLASVVFALLASRSWDTRPHRRPVIGGTVACSACWPTASVPLRWRHASARASPGRADIPN